MSKLHAEEEIKEGPPDSPNSMDPRLAVRGLLKEDQAKAKAEERLRDKDKSSWNERESDAQRHLSKSAQNKGVLYTVGYILPFLFKGSVWVKMATVATALLIILHRLLNVLHPLILGMAVNSLADGEDSYFLVGAYVVVKFAADVVANLRETTFAHVSANAEVFIAQKVYTHIQNQSLAFHLDRETGKVQRIVA